MSERVEVHPVTIIEPASGWISLQLAELWNYRELLLFLAWRDIKVRYQQTVLGATWAIVQPLFQLVVFTLLFSKVGKIPSEGVPYPVFLMAGLLPWTYFSYALTQSANCLTANQNLIQKVYFPRLVVPIASVLAGLVDTMISSVLLIVLMFYYGIPVPANVLWLPAFMALAFMAALGVGLWASAVNVRYRDVRHIIPFVTQFWMYATPIVYSLSIVPEPWKTIAGLNPMAGVVNGFRWALLGAGEAPGLALAGSAAMAVIVMVSGAFYFRRTERVFADLL